MSRPSWSSTPPRALPRPLPKRKKKAKPPKPNLTRRPRPKSSGRTARALREPVEKQTARDLFAYIVEQGKKDYQVQRYKGLGEMTATQLWETTMDPERRTLLVVKLEDIVETERHLHHADGRRRRSAPQVHRRQRPRRQEPRHLTSGRPKNVGCPRSRL